MQENRGSGTHQWERKAEADRLAAARRHELEALRRLLDVAKGDTGQSRRVASFLLAWWNAQNCGGFDLTDLWGVDEELVDDMLSVLGMIAQLHSYPDALVPEWLADFREIEALWRPAAHE